MKISSVKNIGIFCLMMSGMFAPQLSSGQAAQAEALHLQEVADLVIFSYDRPLQLYALLESVEKHMQGVGETIVIYRASEKAHFDYGYQIVAQSFPNVKFVAQGENPREDFKPLTVQATFDSPSKYVIFAVDDIVVKDKVNLCECIELLERTDAYGFYLRLGKHLDFCYTMNRAQRVPELTNIKDDVLSWTFARGEHDWGYPNTVDMTVYRKADIEPAFRSMHYTSPNTLEGNWSGLAGHIMHSQGLCFKNSKIVNLPLNKVQTDYNNTSMEVSAQELQTKFLQGLKLDIWPLFQIKNKSAHIEYQPTFVARNVFENSATQIASDKFTMKEDEGPSHNQKRGFLLEQLGMENLDEFLAQDFERADSCTRDNSVIDEKRIVIVTASYKNAEWHKWNLDSVFDQQYQNWHLIYVDDCSPDGTGELVRAYVKERGFEDKVTVICNKVRRKAMANLYTAIYLCAPTDIVAILDGDDRLAFNDVLKVVNCMYSSPDIWLTYGQYKEYPSGAIGFCKDYPQSVVDNNAFRNHPDGPSHLRTFYAGLFQKIKTSDLLLDGDFFPMTYDLAMMLPMLEMVGEHFRFSPTPLVDYNTLNPINDHKVSKDLQRHCDQVIRSRAQYKRIESPF